MLFLDLNDKWSYSKNLVLSVVFIVVEMALYCCGCLKACKEVLILLVILSSVLVLKIDSSLAI